MKIAEKKKLIMKALTVDGMTATRLAKTIGLNNPNQIYSALSELEYDDRLIVDNSGSYIKYKKKPRKARAPQPIEENQESDTRDLLDIIEEKTSTIVENSPKCQKIKSILNDLNQSFISYMDSLAKLYKSFAGKITHNKLLCVYIYQYVEKHPDHSATWIAHDLGVDNVNKVRCALNDMLNVGLLMYGDNNDLSGLITFKVSKGK